MNYDKALQLSYDFIIENEIATEKELELVTHINGYNFETINGVIYERTSYHDIKQLYDCEQENFIFNDEIIENIENDYFNRG